MSVCQNLKDLRRIAGLTQEEVANRVGLTRQAISSYESGRTQPDLEMLQKLAEVYKTDLFAILYGQSREQKKLHTLRLLAGWAAAGLLLLVLAASCLLFLTNIFLEVPKGAGEAARKVVERRFAVLDVWEALQGAARLLSGAACVLLGALLTQVERLPSLGTCALCAFSFGAAGIICALSFGVFDPVYAVVDYLLLAFNVLPPVFLLLIYRIFLGGIRKKRAQTP